MDSRVTAVYDLTVQVRSQALDVILNLVSPLQRVRILIGGVRSKHTQTKYMLTAANLYINLSSEITGKMFKYCFRILTNCLVDKNFFVWTKVARVKLYG